MSLMLYYIICTVLALFVLAGISMMSKVKTAVRGNLLSAVSLLAGIVITLIRYDILSVVSIYIYMLIGLFIGLIMFRRVKMIEMPQMVALLNGVGGAASAIVGAISLLGFGAVVPAGGNTQPEYYMFSNVTASLALVVGLITLVGSLIAAGKLHHILPQKPIVWKKHGSIIRFALVGSLLAVVLALFIGTSVAVISNPYFILLIALLFSSLFGYVFAIRVGGADMPITISLLNSLSGVAGAVAGMAIGHILLVAVGGIVGASGLLLTQIMCRAMNRSLLDILTGRTSVKSKKEVSNSKSSIKLKDATEKSLQTSKELEEKTAANVLALAKSVIIVPGYGMALAQAQHLVKQLADQLELNGAEVKYAIHPVAGRMPGHMNVLLVEADVSYEQLYEMDALNDKFKNTDAVIVIGANDVLNPAARDAVDTPIYGMPILNVDEAKEVIICNFDLNPGYAGVDNPLYDRKEGVYLKLGDAKESIQQLLTELKSAQMAVESNINTEVKNQDPVAAEILAASRSVIIVPGYGMALAQAQHLVKQLADQLELNGAEVKYAIHPVAGRMPGHMNVLLAEADVSYEQLYEMDALNDEFKNTDAVIVIGANDVLNPAARDAVDTPIYGMPILNVDQSKEIIICNFDLNPGYAGVDNPLYERTKGVYLKLGDAKGSINNILEELKLIQNNSSF
ncbi:MAG TPA: NAD(P)(+) transhydrogenase (Re/Si-specific) subunit beta [Dysgonamonadaceae bacterium]|nr:NAD(P)(+) transhydrogenase (Re/Si-specific) subunit beta [Dysgonamonadaceae bacterium]